MDPIRVMEDMMNGRRDFDSLSPEQLQQFASPAARQEQLLHITVDVDVAPFYDAQGRLQNLHSIWVMMFGQTLVPPVEVRAAGKQALIGWVKTALRERAEALRKRLERDADAAVEEVNTNHWKSSTLFESWTCHCKRCNTVRTGLAGDTRLHPTDVCRVYGSWLPLLGRMEESEMLGNVSGFSHGVIRNRGASKVKILTVHYRDVKVPELGFGRALVVPVRHAVLGNWPALHQAGEDVGSSPGVLFFELAKAVEENNAHLLCSQLYVVDRWLIPVLLSLPRLASRRHLLPDKSLVPGIYPFEGGSPSDSQQILQNESPPHRGFAHAFGLSFESSSSSAEFCCLR